MSSCKQPATFKLCSAKYMYSFVADMICVLVTKLPVIQSILLFGVGTRFALRTLFETVNNTVYFGKTHKWPMFESGDCT